MLRRREQAMGFLKERALESFQESAGVIWIKKSSVREILSKSQWQQRNACGELLGVWG